MASVHEVMEAFRAAPSNAERGAKFEQLMVRYFELDPLLSAQYDRVWRWMDWPGRTGVDTGIDLVARQRETGELTAVQCKFYEPSHTLSKPDIDSFFSASGKRPFSNRIIISTTDRWGKHAEETLADQQIPVERIGLAEIAESPIRWDLAWPNDDLRVEVAPAERHQPRPHQQQAIDDVVAGFTGQDRGKLVMACGTGKTFTALKIAERLAASRGGGARVLFLVPSIALLSQTLREWTAQAELTIRSFAVCSDTKVSRVVEDISPHDVPLPATTDPAQLAAQASQHNRHQSGQQQAGGLTVVFSTYQSLPVVADAQHDHGLPGFDLVVCDEAHRTTGVTLQDGDESHFVRIHEQHYLRADKRLYMTATPRVFDEKVKAKADEYSAQVTSMDDETIYGPLFHRLTFGDAVAQSLLTDYKVLVLTIDEDYIAGPLQDQIVDANHEINLDDATKIVGCWNGLAKRAGADMHGTGFGPGEMPMRRAVAFLRDIRSSKRFATTFEEVVDAYDGTDEDILECAVHHVDGTYNALERNRELAWLKAPVVEGECRILSNARCLSEGIDVPALDAVMFLNPRNSIVDVIQSVGRVMRRAPGKDYGYIILPVGVPSGIPPEKALADNKRFKVVWQVLNALRSHDDRFNAIVNAIDLNRTTQPGDRGDSQLMGGHIGPTDDANETLNPDDQDRAGEPGVAGQVATQAALFSLADWRDAIYARIVRNVGTRTYWEDWAADVATIAVRLQTRIQHATSTGVPAVRDAFDQFVAALCANLNDSITAADAVSMLAQHLITRPVFDALFADYSFAAHNPVSQVMQAMIDTLTAHGQAVETETRDLEDFYASVRIRVSGVTSADGKQQVITELYERFFKLAFPHQAEALGIVYTPVQIVDFLLRAANDTLQAEFGQTLSDQGVHILDGFTGTGTFIVRLLQSGIIQPADLARKYAAELHANEIILLAYYIAAVNIEATYHAIAGGDYTPFGGIVLTDTFQISETGDAADTSLFPRNNDRIEAQLHTPIRVIVSNPPYSVGQGSANDNNANLKYPTLDSRIEHTYAARSTATNKNSLYDSHIRAIRWATDRIGDAGIVAYVCNGGWIDGNTADGLRLTLADEFSSLYVYNLRGNMRQSNWKAEGGQIFGAGSQATIAMLIAVKNPSRTGPCRVRYRDVGDYLTREQKLDTISRGSLANTDWTTITPNRAGDWINQRNDTFTTYPPICSKDGMTVFALMARGLESARDAWVYNFSQSQVVENVRRTVETYTSELEALSQDPGHELVRDGTRISWSRALLRDLKQRRELTISDGSLTQAVYRPFTRTHLYFNRRLNNVVGQLSSMFPTPHHRNVGIYQVGAGSAVRFSVLVCDLVPDLHMTGAGSGGHFFPRWTYEKVEPDENQFDLEGEPGEVDEWGYRRVDNVTDAILIAYQRTFGLQVSKEDIFYYIYGLLHSSQYREVFAADLKKMLPRIPQPQDKAIFDAYVDAGRRLAELHVGYEQVEPYPLHEQIQDVAGQDERQLWRVTKMRWRSKSDHSAIVYNHQITLSGIPDAAHRYQLGSRTALDWIIDRYQIKTDKASGIVNDPNDWCDEHHDPRYIIDLIKKITTVSVETVRIVDQMQEIVLDPGKGQIQA